MREKDPRIAYMAMGRRDSLYMFGYELWNFDLRVVHDLVVSLELASQGMASTNIDLRIDNAIAYDKIYYSLSKCAQVNLNKDLVLAGQNVCTDTALYCLAKFQDMKMRRKHFCPPSLVGVLLPTAIVPRK
jgi:hypothetical protein